MNGAVEWIKAHPWIAGMIALGVGLVVIYTLSGSSSSAANSGQSDAAALAAAQANEAAAGNQLQALQAQLQAADNQTNAGVTANATNDATAATVAQIQATATQNANQTTADAAVAVAGFNAQASETQSSAAVKVNAANDATTLLQQLLNSISLGTQLPGVGASIGSAGEVYGQSYTGQINIAGVPSSFNLQSTPLLTNAYGVPNFITDPAGNVYSFETFGQHLAQGIGPNTGLAFAPVGSPIAATPALTGNPVQNAA